MNNVKDMDKFLDLCRIAPRTSIGYIMKVYESSGYDFEKAKAKIMKLKDARRL